jgi:hypothetical protein
VLSCGIFQPELERLLPEIMRELGGREIEVSFVPPALHVDYKKLKAGIMEGLAPFDGRATLLLFGSMCHPEISKIAGEHGAVHLRECNCIDAMLTPERKRELESAGRTFFLTAGWLQSWRDIFQQGQGWHDPVDARMNLGFYDQMLVLDSGVYEIKDEDLLDFFDYAQVPIDVEPIDLEHFKKTVVDICGGILGA